MPDDPAPDAFPALRWLDAFPWIAAAAAEPGNPAGNVPARWLESVYFNGSSTRAERLADLSDLALEHLTRWTIGQTFPSLPANTVLSTLPMTNRARNALARFGYRTAGDLQGLELCELLDLPQVGIGTVDSILQALADGATLESAQVLLTSRAGTGDTGPAPAANDNHDKPTPRASPFGEDLHTIATWYAAVGTPARPLLGTALPPGSPPEVAKARQRLELLSASDVLAEEQAALDVAGLLQRFISAQDARVQQILARRLFASSPDTLEDLGRRLGVTRERVRQIEARARADMFEALESGGMLETVCAAVRELIGTVLPLADLIALMPALAHLVGAAGQPAWRVLDRLDDAYEIEDGWCASPTILSAQTETLTELQELANPHGVVFIDDLGLLNPSQPHAPGHAYLRDWLSYCGYVLDGGHVFTRTQSVGDRAASILSVVGSPMMSQDILGRFGVERSLSSLRNVLASDDRFERVDRDRWALAEWGLDSYSGVRALVRDEVARNGGQVAMDALIERITGKYSVTASSVVAYASAPPFEAKGGIVRLAAGERDVRKGPERTRRLYRRADAWLYRVKVTGDHLRGSGSPAPIAIAAILDLQHGQSRQMDSVLGPQTISWTGNQPAFGTIRRFLVASDVENGSEIFLVIGDDETFSIELVGAGDTDSLDQALRLIGATGTAARQQPLTALATAIALRADSPAASVIGGYRERGDNDIAELLLSARDRLDDESVVHPATPSADIDEILDLL
ncbi:MAG TPA: sigma factor-like helix-turn-helix DNA-binding protein [Streptosporangiaceae bacterium]|nr:sigma factor-like helix-turn-helix DNA-binding protein [Streptosporangiaceae bacterium]